MLRGGISKKNGFTIVETMIVLAVSSGLFLIAAVYIGGRQAKTEFQVGVRDLQTKIQQVINEVNSGYYPSVDFACEGSSVSNLNITSISSEQQGERAGCIFIGKTIVINKDKIKVFSLAGNREIVDSYGKRDVKDIIEAHATAIEPSLANPDSPSLTESYNVSNGLSFVGIYDQDGISSENTDEIYGASITNSFAPDNDSNGAQSVQLSSFSTPFSDQSTVQAMANKIDDEYTASGAFPMHKEVRLCFESGGTDQSVWLIIGDGTNGGLAVRTEIKAGKTCS